MIGAPDKPDADRFAGCLVGLAVGDALGWPSEGLSRHEIHARWGRITDFLPSKELRAGQFTARTETVMMLCESIVSGGEFEPAAAARAWREWCTAEDAEQRPGAQEMCARFEGGAASDLAVRSADCAAAVRSAPIGLLHCRRLDRLADDAAACAGITHNDPRAVAGALAMAAAVAHLAGAATFDGAALVERAATASSTAPQMAAAIRSVLDLLDLAPRAALGELGHTNFALEAVPAALYCFTAAPDDFAECVLLALNSGGAASSIAAMAGALAGAHLGLRAVPRQWVEGVEESQRLQQLALALHALA